MFEVTQAVIEHLKQEDIDFAKDYIRLYMAAG